MLNSLSWHTTGASVETKNNSSHQMKSVEMQHLNLIDANIQIVLDAILYEYNWKLCAKLLNPCVYTQNAISLSGWVFFCGRFLRYLNPWIKHEQKQ